MADAATTEMTTIEDLHPDIIARALSHMDGPTLAAAGCSTSLLRSLSSDPELWRQLCLSSWPSLRHPLLLSLLSGAHRTFFSQSFPFPADDDVDVGGGEGGASPLDLDRLPSRIVSAVDLYHNGTPVFSRVIDTDTSSSWFLASPFRLDALDRKDPDGPPAPAEEPAVCPEELTLSWAVIDPETRRAANVSSRRPVAVDRHWYTGETLVRFAVVLRGRAVSAVVTCGEATGHVREVSLTVEDKDGVSVSGRESLGVLRAAMEGRRGGAKWEKEVKARYGEYLKRKRERREKKVRREGMLDFCCAGFGALVFLSFLMLLAFR